MKPHLGYYVHHHGRGHAARAEAILRHVDLPVTVLTSADVDASRLGGADVVRLPLDTDLPETERPTTTPAHLHYAPVGVAGLRERTAQVASFIAETAPSLMLVDVSAEVTQLARLAGTPVVVARQQGQRWDIAHLAAYDCAHALLAPFPEELEEPDAPDVVRGRTFYAGGVVRTDHDVADRRRARRRLAWDADDRVVVVLCGAGGGAPGPEQLVPAAAATGHRWVVVGRDDVRGPDIESTGWVDDPSVYLAAADVVVGSAGHNSVMEVAALARPLVCLPADRPFREQHRKAQRLRALDAAEVLASWPPPEEWPGVLARAEARGADRLAALVDDEAAPRAASWLCSLVAAFAS